ncbi:MAG: polyphosphate kinase 1 [Treponema sp.]|nr:polyphosphate kinase 1 [Treponema sp.]
MEETDFINRELSWIEFNARVLNEAARKEIPLLERLKFICIVSSNFDEFFQVRIASVKRQKTQQQPLLKRISKRCHQLTDIQYDILKNEILPALTEAGISYIDAKNFNPSQKAYIESYFRHNIAQVLTPLRTDSNPFPQIKNMETYASFILEQMSGVHKVKNDIMQPADKHPIALVQLPSNIERIIWLPANDSARQFTLLDDVISVCGKELFPGYMVKETMFFQIVRDADSAVDEESKEFIQAMKNILVKRQSSFAVRMVCTSTSQALLNFMQEKLSLSDDDVYKVYGIVNPSKLISLTELDDVQNYLYPEWKNFPAPDLPEEETYWNTLRQKDVLIHVPYESYDPIVKFIKDAARDENVLSIKITLYRTGNDSPIIKYLKEASQNGKAVTVFIELKARFDEERNISWSSELENAGVTVIYGVVNLKVHAKICLIIRKEADGMRRYLHVSTGNYNPKTAKLYQDLSILTSNHEIATDAQMFFNVISGYSIVQPMSHMFMAPVSLKSKLIEMIEREISLSTPENPGHIVAKMNSLCHKEIIEELYKASMAGVKIELNVRGICTLKPGLANKSENIKVISIIDRYLEHSRIFYFKNGGAEELYISSADWMERNLDKRIELMIPITDKNVFKNVKDILFLYFQDNTHSHTLQKDGSWKQNKPLKKEQAVRAQEVLYKKYKKQNDIRKSQPKIEFVVRRKN